MTDTQIDGKGAWAADQGHPEIDTELVPDIANFITTYTVLPSKSHALVEALWVLHTWRQDAAQATPYLYVHSAGPACGKTRNIETLELLVRNPLKSASITPAALFRAIPLMQPTLLWDEVDTFYSRTGQRHEVMRSVIDAGYRRGGFVLRLHRGEPVKYDCFGAKLLAGIFNNGLPETIESRCIPIKLKQRTPDQHVEPLYPGVVKNTPAYEALMARIERWAATATSLPYQRPTPIDELKDRQWEICEPLVAIAATFGEGAEQHARRAITAMFKDARKPMSLKDQLFLQIKEAFGGRDRIFTDDLLAYLGPGWSNGKLLSEWLAPYNINPRNVRIGNEQRKGYVISDFAEALANLPEPETEATV